VTAEKLASRYLRHVTYWRLLATAVALPAKLLEACSGFFRDIQGDIFLLELHAANRYRLLTGSDLGVASGEDARYLGMAPDVVEAALTEFRGHELDPDDED
jgi:hypothetical protein